MFSSYFKSFKYSSWRLPHVFRALRIECRNQNEAGWLLRLISTLTGKHEWEKAKSSFSLHFLCYFLGCPGLPPLKLLCIGYANLCFGCIFSSYSSPSDWFIPILKCNAKIKIYIPNEPSLHSVAIEPKLYFTHFMHIFAAFIWKFYIKLVLGFFLH